MPLNISDAEDAWLGGKADFEEWKQQFLAEWYAPLARSMIGALANSIDPATAEQLRAMGVNVDDLLQAFQSKGEQES